jgi:hypothetical protein
MDSQISIEHEKKWKVILNFEKIFQLFNILFQANSEPRSLPTNDSKKETNGKFLMNLVFREFNLFFFQMPVMIIFVLIKNNQCLSIVNDYTNEMNH